MMQTTSPPNARQSKSIFQSKTFWGAFLTAVAAIAPVVGQNVATYQEKGKIDPNSVAQVFVILATTGMTIMGRIEAKQPIHTPNGLPGPDQSEQ
jgi:anti-sigma-K factor RskA